MLFDKEIDTRTDESATSKAEGDLEMIAEEHPDIFLAFLKERLFRSLLDGTAPTRDAPGPLPDEAGLMSGSI